jgi:hypothetical protein
MPSGRRRAARRSSPKRHYRRADEKLTRIGRDAFELAGNGCEDSAVRCHEGGAPRRGEPLPQVGDDIRAAGNIRGIGEL